MIFGTQFSTMPAVDNHHLSLRTSREHRRCSLPAWTSTKESRHCSVVALAIRRLRCTRHVPGRSYCLMGRVPSLSADASANMRSNSITLTEVLVMADQQQGDSTLGTAGSADGVPRPLKTHPVRPGEKGEAGSNSGTSVPRSNAGRQGRPGSDPKNPGDFGHR